MTSKGNSNWNRQGRTARELDSAAKEEKIRELDVKAALERYGMVFNRHGGALCPFHKEKTASFRIKNKRFWHCFGCGESGELIKFVRKRFGLSYREALDAICRDFALNISKPTPADLERLDLMRVQRYNRIRHYEELLDHRGLCLSIYLLAWETMKHAERFCGGKNVDNERYVAAHFAVQRAAAALERADGDCMDYLAQYPEAKPQTPQTRSESMRCILPKAPKWGEDTQERKEVMLCGRSGEP